MSDSADQIITDLVQFFIFARCLLDRALQRGDAHVGLAAQRHEPRDFALLVSLQLVQPAVGLGQLGLGLCAQQLVALVGFALAHGQVFDGRLQLVLVRFEGSYDLPVLVKEIKG